MLFPMNDDNKSKNLLAMWCILNLLISNLQVALFLTTVIILMIFYWMLNTFLLSVEFPQKITLYNIMAWK
jgi:hypothetical protein